MKLNELEKKKILILGFGREGKDTFDFLRKIFPGKVLGIADQKRVKVSGAKTRLHFGKRYLGVLGDYDLVFKSPGIPFKKIPKRHLGKIITQTDLFFQNCPGKIVGVTGTKGKSTTAALICHILREGGIRAKLAGNIGRPVLTLLLEAKEEDVFVCELSSHQLYNLKKSPEIAVLLNVYPEHLDYYRSFREYADAKANIARYQGKEDFLVYNASDPIVKRMSRKSSGNKIPISGKYRLLSVAAAKKVAKIFRVPEKKILKALKTFKPLPHRLEFVGTFRGIKFYNDSLSTIPEAAIEALDFLGEKVQTLIAGGFDRGLRFDSLARRIEKSEIETLILFPTTGPKIRNNIVRHNLRHFFVKEMKEAVRLAFRHTKKGKICLMSPASPSFNLFKDYSERGNSFKKWVKKMGRGKKVVL